MYVVIGEHYFNDFTRINFRTSFSSLDSLYDYLKKISNNFSGNFGNYFPHPRDYNRNNYEWCGRISACNYDKGRGWETWIYQIQTDGGIVYSTGRFTDGQKFCAKFVREWLEDSEEKRIHKSFNFSEI